MTVLPTTRFTAFAGQSTDLAVTVASANVSFSGRGDTLRIVNIGPANVRFRVTSTTGPIAVTTDTVLLVGVEYLFGCSGDGTVYLAAITASSTATINITRGFGN